MAVIAHYMTIDESSPDNQNEGAEYIECTKCGAATNLTFPSMVDVTEIVIEKWNKRTQ